MEYAVCFANGDGGVVVFGVQDRTRGRAEAIQGVSRHDLDTWRRGIFDSTRPNLTVEVTELGVPEGTGTLLLVRVPKGENRPYGTAEGLFKQRVGRNCMPMDAHGFQRARITSGALDWSGLPADGMSVGDLDPIELARAREVLRRVEPDSSLLRLNEEGFRVALGAVRAGQVTRAGMLLFGRLDVIAAAFPQHQVHYVYERSDTNVARNESYQWGLLRTLDEVERTFAGPANPEREISLGLLKLRIPAYSLEVVREAVLNAVTHRDYADPGEVLIRHTPRQLVVTSPGGFLPGITPQNILRCEPMSRNRTLAEAFQKLRLVERAGIGRRRIFARTLEAGKRMPQYEADERRVILHIFDDSVDERMATLVARWNKEGREIDLDGLLVLSCLRERRYLEVPAAAELLQLPRNEARSTLDRLSHPRTGILERHGGPKAATYRLTKGVASALLGKAACTSARGIDPIRYEAMVRQFLADHRSISPRECRELLGLGDSRSAVTTLSRYLRRWSGEGGFLSREGKTWRTRYFLRERDSQHDC